MPQSHLKLALALATALLTLAACSGGGSSDSGVCLGAQATCTATTQCCTGFACENGSCEFVGSGSSSGSTGASSGGSSGASSSTGGSSGTSGGSSSGYAGPCNCSGATPFCDPVGRCVACNSDSQCAAQAADAGSGEPYCATDDPGDSAYGSCVQCNTTPQCASQGGGVCDPADHICDPSQNCIDGGAGYCASGASGGEGNICDPTTGECVACEQASDCAGTGLPYCDPGSKTCVECLTAAECPYSNAGCYQGACGACGYDGDCEPHETCQPDSFPACTCGDDTGCGGDSPVCEGADGGANGSCGCDADGECGSGNVCEGDESGAIGTCELDCTLDAGFCSILSPALPACDLANGQCIACTSDANCAGDIFASHCLIDGGLGNSCVACLTSGDCADAGSGPFCIKNNCVTCVQDSDCLPQVDAGTAAGPYCENNNCVACNADSQCAAKDAGTPYCSTQLYSCVACDSYSQCPPTAVGCNSIGNTCGGCIQNTDCPPGDGCQFGPNYSVANPYCTGMCGFPGAPADGGCVQCVLNSDCGDAGSCLDGGVCKS